MSIHRSIQSLSAIAIAASAMMICSIPPVMADEPPAEYLLLEPIEKILQFRFFPPRCVYDTQAIVTVDVPMSAMTWIHQTTNLRARLSAELSLRHLSTNLVLTTPLSPALVAPSPSPTYAAMMFQRFKHNQYRFSFNLADWPDGLVETSLNIRQPADMQPQYTSPASQQFRIVRHAIAQIAEPHRDEIKAWIDDANQHHHIWNKLPLWPNLDQALASAQDPFANLRGFMLRSYFNPQLERRQPYTLYVPHALDLSQPAPLMILLHGSGGDYRNLVADYAVGQRFEEHPMLIANAGAFGWLEFRHLALNDVRWIIQDVSAKYRVDPARIYVQGISLGGRGSLELAALMPDLFAGLSAQGVYGVHHPLLDPPAMQQMHPVALAMATRSDIRAWLPNLRNSPVELVYAWQDESTRPVNALVIEHNLRRYQVPVVPRGFNTGHDISMPDYDWVTTRQWFLKQTKNTVPLHITHRVGNLRFNRSAWIQVDELRDYTAVGHVAVNAFTNRTLNIQTHNIARLSYHPPPPDHPNAIRLPAEAATILVDQNGALTFTNLITTAVPNTKKTGQSGPIWDAWSEPLLYVVDTATPPETQARLQRCATESASSDAMAWMHSFTVKADTDVTDQEKRNRTIIFFTASNSANPWRNQIQMLLPAWTEIAGDSSLLPDHDLKIVLRPSPWSDRHYVLIIENNLKQAFNLHHFGTFQEMFQADWLWFANWKNKHGYDFAAAGNYDHHWRLARYTTENFRTSPITR